MKISYEYTKKDLKKYLLKSRLINNLILFIVGIIIYIFITYNKVNLNYLPFYIVGLIIFIYLINKLYILLYIKVNEMLNNNIYGSYILELTPNRFIITLNKSKVNYKYNEIKKLKLKKGYFIIKLKNTREYLTFEKKFFQDAEYNKIIQTFLDKSK